MSTNESSSAAPATRVIGEPFCPYGLFVSKKVWRIPNDGHAGNPGGNEARRDRLTLLAKLLYTYLEGRIGKNLDCWPSLDSICEDLGMCKTAIKRAAQELEEKKFISRKKGGFGASTRYYLLWHERLISEPPGRPIESREDGPNEPSTRPPVSRPDGPSEPPGRPLIDQESFNESLESSRSNETMSDWRTDPTHTESLRKTLAKHFGDSMQTSIPDDGLLRRILAQLDSPDDLSLYLTDLADLDQSPTSWGFFPHDARDYWPKRRKRVLEAREEDRKYRESEQRQRKKEAEEDARMIASGHYLDKDGFWVRGPEAEAKYQREAAEFKAELEQKRAKRKEMAAQGYIDDANGNWVKIKVA